MARPTRNDKQWIDKATAAGLLGVTVLTVVRLAEEGRIQARDLPTREKYLRSSVVKLAQECVQTTS